MDIANALHEHIEVAQAYQEHANEIAQSGEIICHALQQRRFGGGCATLGG